MQFSQVLAAMRGESGNWQATIAEDWLQGRTAFGGIQSAIAVRAMRALVPAETPLRTLQTTFIAPLPVGEVRIAVRVLRSGRSATHVDAQIFDGDQLACSVLGIFGLPRESTVSVEPPAARVPTTIEQARELRYVEGVTPAFTQHLNFRWANGGFPFRGADEPKTQIYVRMIDEVPVGELQLIALADSIPSPGLSVMKTKAMASSLTWMLELLRPDYDSRADGWWLMDAEVSAAHSGYMSQAATLWSPDGKAVALSRQSVVVFG